MTGLPRRGTAVLVAVAAVGGAAVAWPAAAATPRPPAVRALTVTGDQLAFSAARLRAPAGPVRLVLRNRSSLTHDIALRGPNLARARRGEVVDTGGVSRITVTLPAGRYTYFCSVFGHEAAGMRGALVVSRRAR